MTDNYADLLALESLIEIVGETLGSAADGIDVHAVAACAHLAAEATRAELEILVEGVDERALVTVVEHSANLIFGLIVIFSIEPSLSLSLDLFQQFLVFHLF